MEMALSAVVAAIALLVPVAADWGPYKYVPAVAWLLIFVQCLAPFRWRGLWFLLGLPVAFVAIEAFLVAAPPVPGKEAHGAIVGSETLKTATPGATDTTHGDSVAVPPLVVRNPDGTLTVQKAPPKGATEGDDGRKGLRIPPQVIVPTYPTPNNK
jgi:hypothetical protein